MKNNKIMKGLVLGIILLFVGASVIPSMGITSVEKEQEHTNDVLSSVVSDQDKYSFDDSKEQSNSGTSWDFNWTYYRTITINHNYIDTPLSNFPVLVVIGSAIGAKCDGGNSIRFLDTDNSNEYFYEIEYWDASSNSYVWVNITFISNTTNTTFLMYYNNSEAIDNQTPTSVWNTNYVAVWHMNDNTTSTITDSTSNNHDGNKRASGEPIEATGLIGYGQLFDGVNDYISVLDSPDWNFGSGDFTIELWLKNTIADDTNTYFMGQYIDIYNYWVPQIYNGQLGWGDGQGGGANHNCGAFTPTQNEWTNIVWSVANDTELNCYVNTTDYGSTTIKEVGDLADTLCIGTFEEETLNHVVWGVLDEIRISNVARNVSWINTSYHNQNQTTGFLTIGDEELLHHPPITDLQNNWNLVSTPYCEVVNKTDIIVNYNGTDYNWTEAVNEGIILGFIYGWNRTTQYYELCDEFEPGYGYWMYAYYNCTLLRPWT